MLILGFTKSQDSIDLYYDDNLICTVKLMQRDNKQMRLGFSAGKKIEIKRRRLTLNALGEVPDIVEIDDIVTDRIEEIIQSSKRTD